MNEKGRLAPAFPVYTESAELTAAKDPNQRGAEQRDTTEQAEQRQRLIDSGQAVRLGHVITDLALASEEAVVEAINENFRLSVASLSDNIRELILRQRGPLAERLPPPAIPIWLKLCVGALLIVAVTIVSFSTIIINKQKARLFDQTVMVGTVSLNYFANNARIPLIDDDILSLNTLIKEATDTEGLRYAIVTDAATGKVLTDASAAGERIEARLATGRLRATVDEVIDDDAN